MPRISFTVPLSGGTKAVPDRESLFSVLKFPDTGASPKGSTFRKSLIQCPHEHGLLYEIGLRPSVPTEPLTVGLIFHYALQRYYEEIFKFQREFEVTWKKNNVKNPLGYRNEDAYYWAHEGQAAKVAWAAVSKLETATGYEDTWKTVSRIVDGYFDRYSRVDRWRILAVEETIEYYGLASGTFDHSTRLDLLVEDTTVCRSYTIEHKTARWISQDLVDFYDLDLQILGQVWLAARCVDWTNLPPFGGSKINIVSKNKTPLFIRHDVLPSVRHLLAFEHMITDWEYVREFYKRIGWPKALGQCAGAPRGYSKCQFYELCREHPLETVASIGKWRDAPDGFEFKGKDAATFEDHNV